MWIWVLWELLDKKRELEPSIVDELWNGEQTQPNDIETIEIDSDKDKPNKEREWNDKEDWRDIERKQWEPWKGTWTNERIAYLLIVPTEVERYSEIQVHSI